MRTPPLLAIGSLLLALGLSSAASARDASFPDRGVARDPYTRSAIVTTGRAEGFRKLYVDADAFADKVVPAAPIVVELMAPPVAAVIVEPSPIVNGTPIEALPPAPRPTAPSLPPRGDLRVHNGTSAYAEVAINGQKVGRIGPMDAAVLHDVATGQYDLTFTHPDGNTWTAREATVAPQR